MCTVTAYFSKLVKIHPEILPWHPEKPETLAILFSGMLVVLFVRPSDRPEIGVFRIPHPADALVYEDIMNKKIGHPVEKNTKTNIKQTAEPLLHAKIQQRDRWQGEDKEEQIVPFQLPFV
ncbi:hypothetical protein [Chitinophaga rhizosphaerae]|uniref:hypothetical protein n=1 Tax=Chitinophaga rhizosphaerae TaxID=1864947 RepID=UPI00374414D1